MGGEQGGPSPASESRINSIPTVTITRSQARRCIRVESENDETWAMFVSGEKIECTICMDEFKENEQAKLLPCCHYFHEDCISRWLRLVRSVCSSLFRSSHLSVIVGSFSTAHVPHVAFISMEIHRTISRTLVKRRPIIHVATTLDRHPMLLVDNGIPLISIEWTLFERMPFRIAYKSFRIFRWSCLSTI